MRYLYLLLAALLAAPAFAENSTPTTSSPLEPYLKRDIFGTIQISPTGEFLAVSVPLEDRTSLVILRRADMSKTGHVTFEKNVHVTSFNWVNPTRVLFSIGEKFGELESPQGTGEIYGVNADGSGQGPALVGARSRGKGSRGVGAFLVDTLRDNDDYVLISTGGMNEFTQVDRMNVRTGNRITVGKVPVKRAQFLTDAAGQVRFAAGADSDNKSRTYYRDNNDAEWVLVNDEASSGLAARPVGFMADGKTALLQMEEKSGPDAVYAFDVASREKKLVLRDDNVNPDGYLRSPVDGSVYGVSFMDGLPRVEYLDEENSFARQHRNLQASLKGQAVVPLSFTSDGKMALYLAYADRVPGDFYLFDRGANKATYIASKNAWFTPDMLLETKPVSLKARDGLALEGYLTLPKGSSGKGLPLVLNPHGGPFGPYDEWGYNPEVQLLAKHGYAVLQVNFRGSGNYGRAFTRAGYQQWGGTMQDDLTDATRWAIAQGIADPARICIYGGSYGGYASLMGVVKEPDLYRCAIGNVGVYDMQAMYSTGDIPDSVSGKNFLYEALGKQELDSSSPNRHAAKIKVPVLLAAGREDVRAPPIHTERMRDALLAAGKSVETKIYEGEGHGNYLLANRVDFYSRMLAFLDKHIGAKP